MPSRAARVNKERSADKLIPAGMEDEDRSLVERARAGDTGAFYSLVSRHERSVYWAAYSVVGNSADAEEITQEAFLKSFQHLRQFRGESKFSTWLVQIAVNEARMYLRKHRPALYDSLSGSGREDDEAGWHPRDIADWAGNPEQRYAAEEISVLVRNAVASLPPIYRTVLVLRDLEQMSNEEVAQALDLNVPTVKTRLLRARLQLRERLAPHFRAGRRWRLPWFSRRGRP